MTRLVLGVAYDGTGFSGFAAQPLQRTVAGVLAGALAHLLGVDEPPLLVCAGRTDAGVHALSQVVHVDVADEVLAGWRRRERMPAAPGELPALARALSRRLAPDVAVWGAGVAAAGFDARFGAVARRYRYDVEPESRGDPLRARRAWQLHGALDLAAMRLGCDPLIGEHDFAAFCRRPAGTTAGPLQRRVLEARWRVLGGDALDAPLWRFEIEAVAFCHQMVRSIVGLLVAIGEGRARPSDVSARLASGLRSGTPPIAPAHGLCLAVVRYEAPWPDPPAGLPIAPSSR